MPVIVECNRDLGDVVALFDRVEPGVYRLKGTYERGVDSRYSLFRNYFVEWPTFYGQGQTGRVKEIRFRASSWGCKVDFVGERRNPRSEAPEIYDAGYSENSSGLNILWQESSDFLRYSNVTRDQIDL